jgi:predicted TIM-barrel fold metal-dependent hydrolase
VPPEYSALAAVEAHLRRAGVTRAALTPMAGLFGTTPVELGPLPEFFRPVPIVDPRWPDVRSRLAAWRRAGCPAVRISPGSHGYRAVDAVPVKAMCGELGLTLILQTRIADPRNLPADLDLREVTLDDATALAVAAPGTPMIVAGARAAELPAVLGAAPDTVFADLSLAEEPDVLRRAVTAHGAHRVVMGTHAPFLTPAAAAQKLAAARLAPGDHEAVRSGNAERLGF